MNKPLSLSRRHFVLTSAALTGGFAIGLNLPSKAQLASRGGSANNSINLWVEIAADDTVTIKYARCEMGQGSMTSAPQIVADELDANWDQVHIEYVDVNQHIRMNKAWGDMVTVGSQTIRNSQEYLRQGGASARAMLVAAAADAWDVDAAEITVNNGVIRHAASGRESGFGAFAKAAAAQPVPKNVTLKDPADWHIIGQPHPRVDIPPSVDGSQVYGIDTDLPGMVYAAIQQCPVFGGSVISYDDRKARSRRGVIDVFTVDNNAVVVVADNWWRANKAVQEIEVNWDTAGNGDVSSASILTEFRANLDTPDAAALPNNSGDADSAMASADQVIEAEYFTPFLSHSPMEPMGATVKIDSDRVDIWASTQAPEGLVDEMVNTLDVAPESVYVHRVQAGGGFGRRGGSSDYARQAALVAAQLPQGTPVKLLWTREEDTQHDYYRPLAMYRCKAGLDSDGNIKGWKTRIASGSILGSRGAPLRGGLDFLATEGFTRLPYQIADQYQDFKMTENHVPLGFWRTVGWSQTPFAREQFIDELAVAAGKDPYHFRLAHMAEDDLSRHILTQVANAIGWDQAPPVGHYRGIATTEPYGSYTAAAVELSVNDAGQIKIHRIIQGINTGHMVNPDNVSAQLEGSTVWALTAAMWGEITIENGRVKEGNFHDYPMLRMSQMPVVETVLHATGGFWGGVGEPGQAPILPAFCNAIYAATGTRVRSLPLQHHGFSFA